MRAQQQPHTPVRNKNLNWTRPLATNDTGAKKIIHTEAPDSNKSVYPKEAHLE